MVVLERRIVVRMNNIFLKNQFRKMTTFTSRLYFFFDDI